MAKYLPAGVVTVLGATVAVDTVKFGLRELGVTSISVSVLRALCGRWEEPPDDGRSVLRR